MRLWHAISQECDPNLMETRGCVQKECPMWNAEAWDLGSLPADFSQLKKVLGFVWQSADFGR